MSQPNLTPLTPAAARRRARRAAVPDETFAQTQRVFAATMEPLLPWLTEFGKWIFGGLIAFVVFILAAFITIGPQDAAVLVGTIALALALPLDLAGLFLLRLVQDLKDLHFEDQMARALRESGLPVGDQLPGAAARDLWRTRHTSNALLYALGIMLFSVLLTLTGVVAALWHMAWWIGVAFLAMTIISVGMVVVALVILQPRESPEEQARQRQYWEALMSQAGASSPTADEGAPSPTADEHASSPTEDEVTPSQQLQA